MTNHEKIMKECKEENIKLNKLSIQEAIEIISDYEIHGCGFCHEGDVEEIIPAFDIAISSMKKQLNESEINNDT